ncbi:MAG: hypothetical protein QM680_06730 [Luteolibacter sp.]
MKSLTNIAGALLGLAFVAFGAMVLFKLAPTPPPPPADSPAGMFMGAFEPTGYLHFVKVLEVVGGLLVAIPLTRNFGLLIIGPILVNIIAFHVFITGGVGLFSPVLIVLCLLAVFLLWADRKKWLNLLNHCCCKGNCS